MGDGTSIFTGFTGCNFGETFKELFSHCQKSDECTFSAITRRFTKEWPQALSYGQEIVSAIQELDLSDLEDFSEQMQRLGKDFGKIIELIFAF